MSADAMLITALILMAPLVLWLDYLISKQPHRPDAQQYEVFLGVVPDGNTGEYVYHLYSTHNGIVHKGPYRT